jgi:hypothetical protein
MDKATPPLLKRIAVLKAEAKVLHNKIERMEKVQGMLCSTAKNRLIRIKELDGRLPNPDSDV